MLRAVPKKGKASENNSRRSSSLLLRIRSDLGQSFAGIPDSKASVGLIFAKNSSLRGSMESGISEEGLSDYDRLLARATHAEEVAEQLKAQLVERDAIIRGESKNFGRLGAVVSDSQEKLQQITSELGAQKQHAEFLENLVKKLEANIQGSANRAIQAESALQVFACKRFFQKNTHKCNREQKMNPKKIMVSLKRLHILSVYSGPTCLALPLTAYLKTLMLRLAENFLKILSYFLNFFSKKRRVLNKNSRCVSSSRTVL